MPSSQPSDEETISLYLLIYFHIDNSLMLCPQLAAMLNTLRHFNKGFCLLLLLLWRLLIEAFFI